MKLWFELIQAIGLLVVVYSVKMIAFILL